MERRTYDREAMRITVDYNNMMQETLGELLYLFEIQTAFAGELLSLNAFDQPGVEEGKKATYALLGKPGFAEKKAELDNAPAKVSAYIVR